QDNGPAQLERLDRLTGLALGQAPVHELVNLGEGVTGGQPQPLGRAALQQDGGGALPEREHTGVDGALLVASATVGASPVRGGKVLRGTVVHGADVEFGGQASGLLEPSDAVVEVVRLTGD